MVFSNYIYILILFAFLYLMYKNKIDLFHILIFVMPFQSWRYDIGLSITLFQIVLVLIIFINLFSNSYKKRNIFYFNNSVLVLFIFYLIVLTFIVSVFFIPYPNSNIGFLRNEGRFLSQIFLYCIILFLVPISFNYITSFEKVISYFKTWIISLFILSVLGFVQFLVFTYFNIDLFPIEIRDDGFVRSGLWSNDSLVIFRVNSLGGEPKGFSLSLILGFFILFVFNNSNIKLFKFDNFIKFFFIGMAFLSLSTSAIVIFFILISVYFLFLSQRRNFKNLIFFISIILLVFFLSLRVSLLYELINDRLFGRDILSEDYDFTIQLFLYNNPIFIFFGTGLGNVHFLANKYIPYEYLYYMENSIFVAKSGYLRIISELGILGLFIFISVFYLAYKKLFLIRVYSIDFFNIFFSFLVLFLLAYLSRAYVFNELILILAFSTSVYRIYSKGFV